MSTAVDKRVVEMVFNNKDFMKNMNSTSKALDSFDDQINDLGKTTAFEKAANATKPLGVAIEAIGGKAVVMQEIISKVTGKIVDGIFDMVNKVQGKINELTFDQIGAGFNKYEEKIKSVQTIMNATGESIDVVNGQLDKLMWYADETSYSFTDMTSNVGKFTSVGISLDDSVTAMMGIANWAALSGAGVQEASRAMYNFSQAMGAGVMMTKDWVSIENANMATKEFKETVIETAKELKAMGKLGEDYDYDLEGLTYENFRDSLSDGWFTKPIMEEALKKYGNYTEELYKIKQEFEEAGEYKTVDELKTIYDERFRESEELYTAVKDAYIKYGKESKEFRDVVNQNGITMQTALDLIQEKQNEQFNEKLQADADALKKAAEKFGIDSEQFKKAAKDAGYSIEDATEMVESGITRFQKAVKSVSERGFAAGQEAKTFTDAWEAAKDAVSSQWAILYEQVFGNYEEAKIMWTTLANTMWDVFAGPIEQLNSVIGLWVELGGREKLFDTESGAIANLWNGLSTIFDSIKTALVKVFPVFENYENFSYILYDITERFHKFTEGIALDGQQTRILTTVFKGLFSIIKFIGNAIKTVGESLSMIIRAILPESLDWQNVLKFIRDMIEKLDTTSGTFYVNTMKFTGLIITKIHQLKNLIASWNLQERLTLLKEKAVSTFVEIRDKITVLSSAFGGTMSSLWNFVKGLEQGKTFGDLVNEKMTALKDTISEQLQPVLEKLQPMIDWYNEQIETFLEVIDYLKQSLSRLPQLFINVGKKVMQAIKNVISKFMAMSPTEMIEFFNKTLIGSILVTINGFLKQMKKSSKDISGIVQNVVSLKKSVTDFIGGLSKTIEDFKNKLVGVKQMEAYSEMFRSIAISMLILAGAMLIISAIPADDVGHTLTLLAAAFSELIIAYYFITQTATDVIQAAAMKEATDSILKLGLAILLVSIAVSGFKNLDEAGLRNGVVGLGAVVAAMVAFYGLMDIMINKDKTVPDVEKRIQKVAFAMISLSISIAILSHAVKTMGSLDLEGLGKGLLGVGVLLGMIFLFLSGIDRLTQGSTEGEGLFATQTGGLDVKKLLAIAAAMNLIAMAIITLTIPVLIMGKLMKGDELAKGLLGVLALIVEVGALFEFLSEKVSKDMGAGKILTIAFSMNLMSAALISLMIPVLIMGKLMKGDELFKGLIGIFVLITEMCAAFEFLSAKVNKDMGAGKILAIAFAMDLMTAAMIGLMVPVLIMGKLMTGGQLIKGILGMAALLFEIGLFVNLMSNEKIVGKDASSKILLISASMMLMSIAIGMMVNTVQNLASLDTVSLIGGLWGLVAILGAVFGFVMLMKLITVESILKALAVSAIFTAIAFGLSVLGTALLIFKQIDIGTIITALLALVLVLAAFGAMAVVLQPILLPLLAISLILPLIGAGLLLLSLGIQAFVNMINETNPFIAITESIDKIRIWFESEGGQFVKAVLELLWTILVETVKALWEYIKPFYNYTVEWMKKLFGKMDNAIREKFKEFKEKWLEGWNTLTQPVKDWVANFKDKWNEWWYNFAKKAVDPFLQFGSKWNEFWGGIGAKVREIVDYIAQDVTKRFDEAVDKLTEFLSPFFEIVENLLTKLKELKTGLSEGWNNFWDNWQQGVDDLGYTLFGDNGSDTSYSYNAGAAQGEAYVQGAQDSLDIHSPSKKTEEEVGIPAAQGIVNGTTEGLTGKEAKEQMKQAGSEAMQNATDGMIGQLFGSKDEVKDKIVSKISEMVGIDKDELKKKFGGTEGLLSALGINVDSIDLTKGVDINSLVQNADLSKLTSNVDLGNISLDTSNLTLDTSNLNIDASGAMLNTDNIGYNFDESQIHSLAEYQGGMIADGMAEGYANNSDKVTDSINDSVSKANTDVSINKDAESTSTTNQNGIEMIKRFVNGEETLAAKTLDLVKPIKQIEKLPKAVEKLKEDIVVPADETNPDAVWRHKDKTDYWVLTDKDGNYILKDGMMQTQKWIDPESQEGKANKELQAKFAEQERNEILQERAIGKLVHGIDAKGDSYFGREYTAGKVILTDANGHILKTENGMITIYDPKAKEWTQTTMEAQRKRDEALLKAANTVSSSKNASGTTGSKSTTSATTDLDTEAAKKKTSQASSAKATGSSSKAQTGTSASSATQTAATSLDYLREMNSRMAMIYDKVVSLDSNLSAANSYLNSINNNTYTSATKPIPAVVDSNQAVRELIGPLNKALGITASLTRRGVTS